ncbi:hypothetical protein VTN31DRAFT_4603 [Thermomyces dupontii]|uniref:uncharacterized protein n=1 Tax=Talaromyces thermophilus TaxID=28565 RepID=UPI003743F649
MVLELHIWGPAFSLPSIDPQCLATIAYFSAVVPRDAWVLVASSDVSVSRTNELPAVKDGSRWVSKFRNIVNYLREYSNGQWDLDAHLSGLEKADNIAFSTFTESNGQLLIDLYLYVTSQNYYAATSPAYGAILAWPNQWITPVKTRNAAKRRTDHLGLSSLDLEATEEQRERERLSATAAGQIPQSLLYRPRETVTTLLGKTAQASRFRLESLTAELFEPLQELLGKKSYMLSDTQPSSLDALVIGYLSLALVPEVPSPWLRDALLTKTPLLAKYVERMRQQYLGVVSAADAFSQTPGGKLPWRPPESVTVGKIGNTLFNTLADATPIWSEIRKRERLRDPAFQPSKAPSHNLLLTAAAIVAGTTAAVSYFFYPGLLKSLPLGSADAKQKEEEKQRDEVMDLGSAQDLLSVL